MLKYIPKQKPIHKTPFLLFIFLDIMETTIDIINKEKVSNIPARAIFAVKTVTHKVTIEDIPLLAPSKEFKIANIGIKV